MIFQEPKIDFLSISRDDCIATTGTGYTICERESGVNISLGEWCTYYDDKSTAWVNTCGGFCDTSSVTEAAACTIIGENAND